MVRSRAGLEAECVLGRDDGRGGGLVVVATDELEKAVCGPWFDAGGEHGVLDTGRVRRPGGRSVVRSGFRSEPAHC